MNLLDANVLIALGDPHHVHHDRVQKWFHAERRRGWATCPLTENAFLRVMGALGYPGNPADPLLLRTLLHRMCSYPGHQFWADDLSIRDTVVFPTVPTPKSLTDLYLLALAVAHRARLTTLDQRIDPGIIPGGIKAYFVIPQV